MAARTRRRRKSEEAPDPRPRVPQLLPLISELYIVTKESEVARLGDVLKPQQLDFIARCQHQLDTRGQIRMVVLKARQIGVSTIIEAIAFVLAMMRDRSKALVVSHENDSSEHILGMTRTYWDTFVFKEFYTHKHVSRTRLAWTNSSDIHIATAKNIGAGRSRTLQFLHASEVAFWPDPDTLMTGLSKSVPSFGLNCIFLESTANGVGNYFHRRCNAAMKGETDYEFVFYPWYEDPDYTIERLAPELREKYSLLGELDAEEKYLRKQFGISDERLLWRRYYIANECDGDVDKFHQEMPTTPHEAFIATGRNVFSWPKLRAHYDNEVYSQRGKVMRLRGKVRFVEDPQGPLTIFQKPSDDTDWGVYLVGGDPTHAPGGDNAAMQVINRRTLEQVAVYRRQIDPITFGKDMQLLGTYYNMATLAPEATGPGYATIGCIVGDNYPHVYLRQKIEKMQGIPITDLAGWTTNVETKELAIAHLVKLFSEPLAHFGNETYGLVIHDPATLIELRDYVTLEKGLGYGNADGSEYDDGVMALAIAAAVHAIEPKPPAYEFDPMPEPRLGPITETFTTGTADPMPHDRPVEPHDDDIDEPDPPWAGIEHWQVKEDDL